MNDMLPETRSATYVPKRNEFDREREREKYNSLNWFRVINCIQALMTIIRLDDDRVVETKKTLYKHNYYWVSVTWGGGGGHRYVDTSIDKSNGTWR